MRFDDLAWTREPEKYVIDGDSLRVTSNIQLTECAWKAHDGQQPD